MSKTPKLRFKEFSGDWEEKKLEEISSKIGDGIHTTPSYIDNSEIKFINGNNIKNHKVVINENTKSISKEEYEKYNIKLNNNSILMSINGTIGNVGYYNNEKVLLGKSVAYININSSYSNRLFIGSLLETNKVQQKLINELTGSTIKNLSLKSIRECKLYLPLKEEQEKIASFFSLIDDKIYLQDEKLKMLKDYKNGMMQKIFSRELRFKDDEGRDYPEWEEKKIKDVFKITRGYVLSANNVEKNINKEYIYPVYSSQTKDKGLLGYYNEYLYEDAITWTTDGANAGTVHFRRGKFYCTNVCGVLISENGYANKCIAEMINRISKKYVSYVGNPKLMNNIMAEIKIDLPCLKEQQKISDILSLLDEKIDTDKETLEHLKQLKKGLLQQMFA